MPPSFSRPIRTGFLVRRVAGRPVSAISVVNHSESFAFLGLYLCHPDFRGRGHGLAIWNAGLAHAGARTDRPRRRARAGGELRPLRLRAPRRGRPVHARFQPSLRRGDKAGAPGRCRRPSGARASCDRRRRVAVSRPLVPGHGVAADPHPGRRETALRVTAPSEPAEQARRSVRSMPGTMRPQGSCSATSRRCSARDRSASTFPKARPGCGPCWTEAGFQPVVLHGAHVSRAAARDRAGRPPVARHARARLIRTEMTRSVGMPAPLQRRIGGRAGSLPGAAGFGGVAG